MIFFESGFPFFGIMLKRNRNKREQPNCIDRYSVANLDKVTEGPRRFDHVEKKVPAEAPITVISQVRSTISAANACAGSNELPPKWTWTKRSRLLHSELRIDPKDCHRYPSLAVRHECITAFQRQ